VRLDPARNAAHGSPASVPGRGGQVRIVATREDLMIARHSRGVLFAEGGRRERDQRAGRVAPARPRQQFPDPALPPSPRSSIGRPR